VNGQVKSICGDYFQLTEGDNTAAILAGDNLKRYFLG